MIKTLKKEYERLSSFAEQDIHFYQIEDEIVPFMEFVISHLTPSSSINFMEIGLAFGGNFVFMGNCLSHIIPAVNGYAIDLPTKKRWRNLNFKIGQSVERLKPNFSYILHLEASRNIETFNRIKEALEENFQGNMLDLLFIDGDHTYRGCKGDFDLYGKLVRKGGLIAFHDIRGTKTGAFKVWKFWNEIKGGYEHREFVTREEDNGIGVLIKK